MINQDSISLYEFTKRLMTEAACREHLFEQHAPDGFICPNCDNDTYFYILTRKTYQCKKCRRRTPKSG